MHGAVDANGQLDPARIEFYAINMPIVSPWFFPLDLRLSQV